MRSLFQRQALRPYIIAGLVAAAGIVPAGCAVPGGNGLVPQRSIENQSRALPANQSRALPANQSRALPASQSREAENQSRALPGAPQTSP